MQTDVSKTYHFNLQGRKSVEQETTEQQVVRRSHPQHFSFLIGGFSGLKIEVILFFFPQNIGSHTDYTALYPRRWHHFYLPLFGHKILH
jgi:hypothetical protein